MYDFQFYRKYTSDGIFVTSYLCAASKLAIFTKSMPNMSASPSIFSSSSRISSHSLQSSSSKIQLIKLYLFMVNFSLQKKTHKSGDSCISLSNILSFTSSISSASSRFSSSISHSRTLCSF